MLKKEKVRLLKKIKTRMMGYDRFGAKGIKEKKYQSQRTGRT